MSVFFIDPSPAVGRPGDVHTSQKMDLGAVRKGSDGSEYIYLQGCALLADGEWVTYVPGAFVAARLVAGAKGPVAIASGAVLATNYGWFMIVGSDTAVCESSVVSNANLYACATTGRANSTIVKNDQIKGARTTTAGVAAGTATVVISRPFIGSYDESA